MITANPKTITPAVLEVVVMPNGEVICAGKTLGTVRGLGQWLTPSKKEKPQS